jgi:hypothetical protein
MAITVIASVVAALWFGATAISQFRNGVGRWIKAHDPFALVPMWTFFAPNPGTRDLRLLWRDRLVDGTLAPWHELLPPDTGFRRALWNPWKRQRKAVFDAGQLVAQIAAQSGDDPLVLVTFPFVMLLAAVSAMPASALSLARQFVIVDTAGSDDGPQEPRLILASHWHELTSSEDMSEPAPSKAPVLSGQAA